TRIQAARTCSTPVRLERRVRRELQGNHQRTQEGERPDIRVYQAGVLSGPSKSRTPRQVALENRSGVHIGLSRNRSANAPAEPVLQLAQPVHHDVVVVVAPRISCNRATRLTTT